MWFLLKRRYATNSFQNTQEDHMLRFKYRSCIFLHLKFISQGQKHTKLGLTSKLSGVGKSQLYCSERLISNKKFLFRFPLATPRHKQVFFLHYSQRKMLAKYRLVWYFINKVQFVILKMTEDFQLIENVLGFLAVLFAAEHIKKFPSFFFREKPRLLN